jgi:hypothetical protein
MRCKWSKEVKDNSRNQQQIPDIRQVPGKKTDFNDDNKPLKVCFFCYTFMLYFFYLYFMSEVVFKATCFLNVYLLRHRQGEYSLSLMIMSCMERLLVRIE